MNGVQLVGEGYSWEPGVHTRGGHHAEGEERRVVGRWPWLSSVGLLAQVVVRGCLNTDVG